MDITCPKSAGFNKLNLLEPPVPAIGFVDPVTDHELVKRLVKEYKPVYVFQRFLKRQFGRALLNPSKSGQQSVSGSSAKAGGNTCIFARINP